MTAKQDGRANNGGPRKNSGPKPSGIAMTQVNARVTAADKAIIESKGYTVRQVIEWAVDKIPDKS